MRAHPRTHQRRNVAKSFADSFGVTPRRAIRDHVCAYTRMALLVEDHLLTQMKSSTLREIVTPGANSHGKSCRYLLTPWEKFAPRATRDSACPLRRCPTTRVAPTPCEVPHACQSVS